MKQNWKLNMTHYISWKALCRTNSKQENRREILLFFRTFLTNGMETFEHSQKSAMIFLKKNRTFPFRPLTWSNSLIWIDFGIGHVCFYALQMLGSPIANYGMSYFFFPSAQITLNSSGCLQLAIHVMSW